MHKIKYVLSITMRNGKKETLEFDTKNKAWEEAKILAMNEAEYISQEEDCEVSITIDSPRNRITLYYTSDGSYSYYQI